MITIMTGVFALVGALIAFGVRVSVSPETNESRGHWRERAKAWVDRSDRVFVELVSTYGILVLRWALATVYIWYGWLKLVDASPAADLVVKTLFWLPPHLAMLFVGGWEVLIGIGLVFPNPLVLRTTLYMFLMHMAGTFQVFVLLPSVTFQGGNPMLPTLEGQYTFKNVVLIAAALTILGTLRRPPRDTGAEGHSGVSLLPMPETTNSVVRGGSGDDAEPVLVGDDGVQVRACNSVETDMSVSFSRRLK
jgi:uncharacterized membrane protein YphA (DoxX/SURF4 family)